MKSYSFLSESITNHILKFALKNSTSKKTREKIKDKYQQHKEKKNSDKEKENNKREEFRPVDLSIEDQQDEDENPFED